MVFIEKHYNLLKLTLIIIAIITYGFINRYNYSGPNNFVRTNIFTGEVSVVVSNDTSMYWENQKR